MRILTHVVSLGYHCRTARRLRDHYGFNSSLPFDWWLTPLEGAVRFLNDWDVEALYDPRLLKERWLKGRFANIVNARYGIRLEHEFPRDETESVSAGWREHIAQAKARTAHLMDKFERMNRTNRRVLVVRELSPEEVGQASLQRELYETACRRLGRARLRFLLISPTGVEAPGWNSLKIDDRTQDWQGDAALWDEALDRLGFTLVQPPETPGEETRAAAR